MALVGDGELAVTKGIPQLDGTITGTRDDLAVVGREGDGQNVIGVANEAAGGGASGELPEPESLVPRGGQSVSTVGGNNLMTNVPSVTVSNRSTSPFHMSFLGDRAMYIRSRRQCGSDRGEIAWDNRIATHRG